MRKAAFKNYLAFREMSRSGNKGHLCLWNYATNTDNELDVRSADPDLGVLETVRGSEDNMCLPDSPYTNIDKAKGKGWCWYGEFKLFVPRSFVK